MTLTLGEHRRLAISNCSRRCSFWPDRLGDKADAVHAVFESGRTGRETATALSAIGITTNQTSVWRHSQHLSPAEDAEDSPTGDVPATKTMDFLDAVIAASFRNRKHWKPSIKDGLDALKLRNELNGGSDNPMAEMLRAMGEALDEPEPDLQPDDSREENT